jgi:hypothetical protein
MLVKSQLMDLGLHFSRVELGETEIMEDISGKQLEILSNSLKKLGLN